MINRIQRWCDEIQDEINFKTAITDNEDATWTTRWNEIYYSEFFLFFDLDIPKSKLLEMLSFDIYGSGRHSVEKVKETITDKIIRLIGEEEVGNTLIKNLRGCNLSFHVLENHVGWAKRLNLISAKPFIKNIVVNNPKRSDYGLNRCLDTYTEFGGDSREFTFIFDFFDTDNQFHWYLLEKMAEQGVFKRKIESLFHSKINPESTDENLFQSSLILIESGSIIGLIWFVQWYKSRPRLSDRDKFIKKLDKISLEDVLPYLKELIIYILNQKINNWRFSNPISKIFKLLEPKSFVDEPNFEKIVGLYDELLLSKYPKENEYYLKNSFFAFESEYYLQKVDFCIFSEVKKCLYIFNKYCE